MLYKPELAQDANSGKAAINALTVILPFPGQLTPIGKNFRREGGFYGTGENTDQRRVLTRFRGLDGWYAVELELQAVERLDPVA
jgi:hypothetical protein